MAAGQRTHVEDIVGLVERLDLRDVVLVGHSYAGIPVGQAATLIGDRLAHVVFVDSNVPADGESFVSGWPDGRAGCGGRHRGQRGLLAAARRRRLRGPGPHRRTDRPVPRRRDPHPGATLTEPATLTRSPGLLPTTYVKCLLDWPEPSPEVAELLTSELWRLVTMDTGHWPMFSQPDELTRVLLDAAGRAA